MAKSFLDWDDLKKQIEEKLGRPVKKQEEAIYWWNYIRATVLGLDPIEGRGTGARRINKAQRLKKESQSSNKITH